MRRRFGSLFLFGHLTVLACSGVSLEGFAQEGDAFTVSLIGAPPVEFPSQTDSNSPAFWDFTGSAMTLKVLNSVYSPSLSSGLTVDTLGPPQSVSFASQAGRLRRGISGGRWMEAVVPASNGKLYGLYTMSPRLCARKTPRIGRARQWSVTWRTRRYSRAPDNNNCATYESVLCGGVGDFTAALTRTSSIYIFYTYSGRVSDQGVAAAKCVE